MSLEQVVDNTRTDKNTVHSLYEPLSNSKKETAKNVLEVGIHNGGSIKSCSDYFLNANIYGLDIMNIDQIADEIKREENIILYTSILISLSCEVNTGWCSLECLFTT
jgi:hypothetical protein